MGKGKGAMCTPYGLFVHEQLNKMKRQGRKPPSFSEAFSWPEISTQWQEMSEDDKADYKLRAKANKEGKSAAPSSTRSVMSVATAAGDVWDDEDTAAARSESAISTNSTVVSERYSMCASSLSFMDSFQPAEYLSRLFSTMTTDEVTQHKMYFMASNIMVKTATGIYYPLELGLVEYSLLRGVTNSENIFVDPGSIPFGYAADANEHKNIYHKIPLVSFSLGNPDFASILETVVDFLSPNIVRNGQPQGPTIIVCDESLMDSNKGSLEFLSYRGDFPEDKQDFFTRFVDSIAFVSTVQLLSLLGKHVAMFELQSEAHDAMNLSCYDYQNNTNLPDDNRYCAVGNARKWTYLISKALCNAFGITISAKHIPTSQAVLQESFTSYSKANGRSTTSTLASVSESMVAESGGGRDSSMSGGGGASSRLGHSSASRAMGGRASTPIGLGRGMRPLSRTNQ